MTVVQGSSAVIQVSATIKAVISGGSFGVCCYRHPRADHAGKARKLVNSHDHRSFRKADTGKSCGKDYSTKRSHNGLRKLSYSL